MASVRKSSAPAPPERTSPSERELRRPDGVPADAILRVLRVPPEAAGKRLDVFVQSQLRNTSRTRARAIVENSAFSPDGRRLKANDRLRAEDHVILWRAQFESDEEAAPLPVVYEDPHLLVIDKPPLLAVHPTARHHRHTVIKRLQRERPGEFFALVHRLDRETSGILLIARSPEADRAFKRILEDRSTAGLPASSPRVARAAALEKIYLAITWGHPAAGMIDAPLELDRENPLRVKMRIAARGTGMDARTEVTLLETRPGYALVSCVLHTGRQHQIRLHLASIGCPVVGDKLYGPDERLLARAADGELSAEDLQKLELPRHALHAHQYRIPHGISGELLTVTAPLAADLREFWDNLPVSS
ncbi:MAG TPA: RluA family pseudouridine synthase [Polyangiaceae bacterium]|nr:RluA family pseudouridine synthase [Polyangiaceae bacterium]